MIFWKKCRSIALWLLLFVLMLASNGYSQSMAAALKLLEIPRYQEEIYLDYQADSERQSAILGKMNSLEAGMSPAELDSLLGAPDEVEPVYDAAMRGEAIKWVKYTYLLSRTTVNEWGKSVDDQSIVLTFNLSGQLVSAVGNGVPKFQEIVREQGLGFRFEIGLHEKVKIEDLLLQLDFVVHAGEATEGGNSEENEAENAKAMFTISLIDRKGSIELMEIPDKRTVLYRNYKISLNGIRSSDVVLVLVE